MGSDGDGYERTVAHADYFEDYGEGYSQVIACGGTDDDPHMIPMKMVFDAATPYGVCPKCGSRSFLHNREVDDE